MESTNVPKRVLIFAGAGASTAVNQDKYPTTIQFYERLPKGIQGNTLFKIVVEFLSATRGSRPLDIEEVLWALREINEAIAWHPKEHPLAWMMERNALGKVFGSSDNFRVIVQRMRDLVREVKKLTDEINVQVYSLYKSSPSPSELNTTWKKVFVALRSVLNPIELVTTNYDRVLDAALRRDFISQAVVRHTREDSYGAPVLDLECWKRDLALKSIRLTKLHGSIDWLQGTDSGDEDVVVRTGVPEHRGGPLDGRILLYPGFKGMPEVEPFRTLHESFTGAVRHAGHALFIGFAFRDEAISHVLKTWMSPECRVMVVAGKNFDKSRLPACEAMAKAEVVPAYFQEKEAETAISNFFGSLR